MERRCTLTVLCFGLLTWCSAQHISQVEPYVIIQSEQASDYDDPLFFIDGQLSQYVRDIHEDRDGNLWFGSSIYGLMRYDGDTLTYYDQSQGIGSNASRGIVEDDNGHLWIGTSDGLTKYDGATFSNYHVKDGRDQVETWDITMDSDGIIWIGTGDGVYTFDGVNFEVFPLPKVSVHDTTSVLWYKRVTKVYEDSNQNMWIGTDGMGLFKYDGTEFQHFSKEDGLADNNIADLLEDPSGDMWIGTMFGGMSRYDGSQFFNYTLDGIVRGVEAGALYLHPNGDIWFAAEHHGVYRYDGEEFSHYDAADGLESGGIICNYVDSQDRHWFGGWGGLFRYEAGCFRSCTKNTAWE
ncbi:MAG: two-component regulator propeller domain-containing protein [Bacteroidota bacterium]